MKTSSFLLFFFLPFLSLAQIKTDPMEDSIRNSLNSGDFQKGLNLSQNWADQLKKQKGEKTAQFTKAQVFIGKSLMSLKKFDEAEETLKKAIVIQKNILGEFHEDVADTYYSLGVLFERQKKYPQAIENLQNSVQIYLKAKGPQFPKIPDIWEFIGNNYFSAGDLDNAEKSYQSGIEAHKKSGAEENERLADLNRMLGIVYKDGGQFSKMETCMLRAFDILKKILPENHPKMGEAYNNVGAVYSENGNYKKAVPYMEKGLAIRIQHYGENNQVVGQSYLNLGALYSNLNENEKALECSEKAIRILKEKLGEDHIYLGYTYLNTGSLLEDLGQIRKAEQYLLLSYQILEKNQGKDHPDIGTICISLAEFYSRLGENAKAEKYALEALEVLKKNQNPLYYGFSFTHGVLGNCLAFQGNPKGGFGQFQKSNQVILQVMTQNFPSLSDEERENFFNRFNPQLLEFKAFSAFFYPKVPEVTGELFNFQLATKGLLLNSSAKWKHRIKSSGDVKLFTQYTQWLELQKEIVALQQSGEGSDSKMMDSLHQKSEKMEKEMSLRSESFARLTEKKPTYWQDIQKKLKPGEAAIEIVRINKPGISEVVLDSSISPPQKFLIHGPTDTIWYAALVLKPGMAQPEMVVIKNGNDLEGKWLNYYKNSIKRQTKDGQSYSKYWEKIGIKLGPVKRVYFSPDGVYHHLNLSTLYNPKTKKYLLEETDIRVVTVTKDILSAHSSEVENKLANLVGFPDFYKTQVAANELNPNRKSPELSYTGLRWEANEVLAELPGTKMEVEQISNILKTNGWEVQTFTAEKALEENLKESYKPGLLHIATHGFFQPESKETSNPLLRSGLMLTGAGSTLKGEVVERGEDGILTAYEAMNLNLDNTDLVVLSACETGLGEVKNGEGVYGLQRAFKVAGARSIIMSLWKVDDEATQELMVRFYRNWLSPKTPESPLNPPKGDLKSHKAKGSGSSPSGRPGGAKRSAFLAAQKELKAKYPNPYFWGAFVMVGE